MSRRPAPSLAGRRVLITGAARGIGRALAVRLHRRGAEVALLGLEAELLEDAAAAAGGAPWRLCDVGDHEAMATAVDELAEALGGLDVVVANAGIGKQLPLIGGDPEVLATTLRVNVVGVHNTISAAGPHVAHPGGYVLLTSSLGADINLPLMGAYSASKAAVEALATTLRQELHHTGARVGVASFAELDTDMTSRGFDTDAARTALSGLTLSGVAPLGPAIDAVERGIARRDRRIVSPSWVGAVRLIAPIAQAVVARRLRADVPEALRIAREETVPFTTEQPVAATGSAAPDPPGARDRDEPLERVPAA
ncbi:SDR family NAD(P)-dependent oxidoreductase [Patulibacter sp.]|uniref:SDR family NAD(P)-dependent oxidoreductase n=1 Tax=Patulibacter sp. TaxID=1912859 RepID=UPI00271C6A8B|nr:SDR family NAD(P)-dependent oxidoreductase [Patulibacter sp.]MDO9410007.1 SDR family NAD(P)-dependent oxidoreductase [Patulibacter sp.]